MYICNIIAILTTVAFIAHCEEPVVETSHGKIKGKVLKTLIGDASYFGFMGIPYAVPPVKDLKFSAPKPIEPWEEVLSTTKEKPACVQFNKNIKKGQKFGNYGTEDCLYLDIFTSKLEKNNLATIVFLHNYNFANSYNKTKDYAPDFFIEEDVIIVTISHRLSVLGFLSLEDDIVTGNMGLKDIVEGLKWINNNIEQFGGDPKKITLMGSFGGATAVDLLIHTNARQYFTSAILQSGTALSTAVLQNGARERAFALGKILDFSTSSSKNLLKFLKDASTIELLERDLHACPKDYNKENQRSAVAFGPILEKQEDGLIKEYPEDFKAPIDLPIMIGFNSREGLESSLEYLIEPRYLGSLEKDFPFLLPMRLKFKFDPIEDDYYTAIQEIKKFYFRSNKVKIKHVPEYMSYIGDVMIAYNVDFTAKMYSNKTLNSVYYYYFDYYSELNENKNDILKLSTVQEGTWGTATGDELCYLFKCPSLKKVYKKYEETTSEARNIQKKMVKMWANFAKYGNPTPVEDITLEGLKWPPYDPNTKEYLHINKQMEVKTDLYKDRFQFWDRFIGEWQQKIVNVKRTESSNKHDEF